MSGSERDFSCLTMFASTVCLSWSSVLTRGCAQTSMMKILMQAVLNVHPGRRFPTPGLHQHALLFMAHEATNFCRTSFIKLYLLVVFSQMFSNLNQITFEQNKKIRLCFSPL